MKDNLTNDLPEKVSRREFIKSSALAAGAFMIVPRYVLGGKGYVAPSDRLVVDVIDNGKGLPQENRHRILEPYMTMREKGTGLGLPIVKKIIEEHGGQLELHDAPPDFDNGKGAMIRILLPRGADTAAFKTMKVEADGV